MNKDLPRPITDEEIETYRRDGIVCLRGLFDSDWVEFLRSRVAEDQANPSGMVKNINQAGATGDFFGDTFVCHHNAGFRQAVFDSPAADLAATLFDAEKVNLIFDQILVKEPGTSTRTLWHHDATYWPVAGDQIATLWLALDPVTHETGAVEYVKGSASLGSEIPGGLFRSRSDL